MTPPSVATISDKISVKGKSVTSSVRPSSPYRARLSINGKPLSDEEIVDMKTSTGETNDSLLFEICPQKLMHSLKFLKFNKFTKRFCISLFVFLIIIVL